MHDEGSYEGKLRQIDRLFTSYLESYLKVDYEYLAEVCLSIPLQDIFDLFHEGVQEPAREFGRSMFKKDWSELSPHAQA